MPPSPFARLMWLFILFTGPIYGQGIPFPGGWTGNAEWVADGTASVSWGIAENNYPSNAKSISISTTVTGPGLLAFQWSCDLAGPISSGLGSLRVQTPAGSRSIAPVPNSGSPSWSSESVPLVAGSQTVTFTLQGDPGRPTQTSYLLTARLSNLAITAAATLADALDTSATITGSGGWAPIVTAQRDYVKLPLGSAGTIGAQITGPAVVTIKAEPIFEGSGPSGNIGQISVKYSGPGVTIPLTMMEYTIPLLNSSPWGFSVPAGTHSLSWSANSGYSYYGDGITWGLDALKVHQSSDFSNALDNTLVWVWNGDPGALPYPQAEVSHDATDAICFTSSPASGAGSGGLSTSITGPQLISFWWKSSGPVGSFQLQQNGANVSLPLPSSDWTQQFLRLPSGEQTLEWRSNRVSGYEVVRGWLDQVAEGSPFQKWMATYLTDQQLNQSNAMNPLADSDGDGRGALMEYFLQTSPHQQSLDREPQLEKVPAAPNSYFLTWRQSSNVTGLTVIPQETVDLQSWTPMVPTEVGIDGTDRIMRADLTTGRWARLKIQQ